MSVLWFVELMLVFGLKRRKTKGPQCGGEGVQKTESGVLRGGWVAHASSAKLDVK